MLPKEESIRYRDPGKPLPESIQIIDVRSADAFAEAHLPRARNVCVYETAFLDEMKKAFPDHGTPLLVYGQNERYKAAEVATDRLAGAGFTQVEALRGGIDAWLASGHPVEGDAKAGAVELPPAGRYPLDAERSCVRWIGRNLTNQHEGQIACQKGWLQIGGNGTPEKGSLALDMKQITCNDISDTKMNQALIAHLSHSDFFETNTYPTASFELDSLRFIDDAPPGLPNAIASGRIALRGVTQPIELKATLERIDTGFVFQTQFDLDRTRFGALYGSGRFFERLGMHLVNDLANVQVTAFFDFP